MTLWRFALPSLTATADTSKPMKTPNESTWLQLAAEIDGMAARWDREDSEIDSAREGLPWSERDPIVEATEALVVTQQREKEIRELVHETINPDSLLDVIRLTIADLEALKMTHKAMVQVFPLDPQLERLKVALRNWDLRNNPPMVCT